MNYKDSKGNLWLKSPGYLTVFDPVRSRYIYNVDSVLKKDFGITAKIHDLFIDNDKDIWFVTADHRLVMHDNKTSQSKDILRIDGKWGREHGKVIEISSHGDIAMICTSSGVMKRWNKKKGQFVGCDETFKGIITDSDRKFRIVFDSKGGKWVMYGTNVWKQNPGEKEWRNVVSISGGSNFFTSIVVDKKDNIWLGSSWSGLRVINGKTLEVEEYAALPLESGEFITNDIQDLHVDNSGGVWIGTLWQGMAYYHEKMNPFRTFHTKSTSSKRNNESVRAFIEEPNGDILVATSFSGITRYNPVSGEITQERPDLFPVDDVYMTLYRDSKGALWVGSYLHGFIRVMPDGSVERYNYDSSADTNVARAVMEDSKGNFWVAVNDKGTGRLDLSTGKIEMMSEKYPEIAFHKRDLGFTQIAKDNICVFGENGVYTYNTSNRKLNLPQLDTEGHRYFSACNGVITDTRGLIWSASDEGIVVSIPDKNAPKGYRDEIINQYNSILPSNYVSSIIEDKLGLIWATTASGLVKISVKPEEGDGWKFEPSVYLYDGGLNAGRVTENAIYLASTGDIYIGGYNGVIRFNPEDFTMSDLNTVSETPLITGLSLFGKRLQPGEETDGRVIVETSLLNGQKVTLNHDENFITVRFSSLDFISGSHKHYKYRLKGYDPDWVELSAGSEPQAIYTGLQPGRYEFEVMMSGIDGTWSKEPATMTIVIRPPFWKTWWAYLLYFLLGAALIGYGVWRYNSFRRKKERKNAELKELMQKEQLNQMKFQFFTNISHEFRTPLTLIMTPLSHILQNENLVPELKKKLGVVYNNAENLLRQVNRLLDFRKLEMGGEKLNVARCRIVQLATLLTSSFDNITEERKITLPVVAEIPEDTDVYIDVHKMRHVLTNLYSNAIKFTPDGGIITTRISFAEDGGKKMLCIRVSDTGVGISEKDLPSIFDRFYQANNANENPSGSGIGLHLVREYVRLHDGTISVESKLGEGTTFTILIPTDLTPDTPGNGLPSEEKKSEEKPREDEESDKKGFSILIAEDNNEFRQFLEEYLSAEYSVETAADGQEALEKARKTHPDVIVSDLMMPRMDGFELIRNLKEDISTSHIPVILLTAKASDESRIESYKVGADSYISKPFNFDVLQARVKMLLTQAQKRKTAFRQDVEIEPSAVTITSLDEKMVKKALETVEANIDNPSFSTVQLGEALGMSRSQLYRKFESVTGMSPAEFIQRMRLKRAAQLLRDTKLNVSEIADMTDFNSIKYFNKHFKEEYSKTPTEYRNSQAAQNG